ncbi:adhesin [Niallia taxi]|nr:adhesin [Niallia taxi]MDE5055434.1 adhesin [Niallia taxi]
MKITEVAENKLLELIKENGAQGIRFYFAGQGCCGPQLGVSLDSPETTDKVFTINKIQVALDERVQDMSEIVVIDFTENGLVLSGLPEQNC